MYSCGWMGPGGCWVVGGLVWVLWGLVASAALYGVWNHVVKSVLSNIRAMKFWQALLVVVTVSIFCVPNHVLHKGGYGMRGHHKGWMHKMGNWGCHEGWEKFQNDLSQPDVPQAPEDIK